MQLWIAIFVLVKKKRRKKKHNGGLTQIDSTVAAHEEQVVEEVRAAAEFGGVGQSQSGVEHTHPHAHHLSTRWESVNTPAQTRSTEQFPVKPSTLILQTDCFSFESRLFAAKLIPIFTTQNLNERIKQENISYISFLKSLGERINSRRWETDAGKVEHLQISWSLGV